MNRTRYAHEDRQPLDAYVRNRGREEIDLAKEYTVKDGSLRCHHDYSNRKALRQ